LAADGLGLGVGVCVGGIKGGDADVQCLSHMRERLVSFDL
jgi:hypothetical protein